MAIIACKECGHQVSDKAASCPSCGAPLAAAVKPRGRAKRVVRGFLITSVAVGLIAAVLWLIGMSKPAGMSGIFNHAAEHSPAGNPATERPVTADQSSRGPAAVLAAVYQTTAEQLYQDYGTNAVATQNRIGDSSVRVTGSVTEIDEDVSGHPIVKLWASDGQSVDMMLNDDQKSAAADLTKGEAVDIQCDKMQATSAAPRGSGCAVVLVDATSKQAYLAVSFSEEKGIAPVYIVGPMSKAACMAHSDSISAQLNTDLKGDHIVSKNCAATARDSIPSQGCHLSSSMSSVPDMPAAHLWRYDCVAPGAASRRATETVTVPHKSHDKSGAGVVVMSIPAVPDAGTGAGAAATSAAATGHSAAAQPAGPPAPVAEAPVAETQKIAPSVAAPTPAPEKAPVPEKAKESAPAVPGDLLEVKLADPGAADHILTYCNTATAGAADQAAVAAGCRHEEASAWTRFVLHNEFPTMDEATRQKCNAPPFPDSYVAKETCAKYQLRIN
jgi:TusA-related sulfurtransferase